MLRAGFQPASWYSEKDPEPGFEFYRSCGFDAIDFGMGHLGWNDITKGPLTTFYDQSAEELIEYYRPTAEAMKKNGIFVSQMHAPFPSYVEGNDATNEYLIMVFEKCLAVAQSFGCPALVVHPALLPDNKEKEIEVNFALYRRLIPAAKKYGVKVCLENIYATIGGRPIDGTCTEAAEACMYIDKLNEEAGEDCFGFCFDVGHGTMLGVRPRQFINTLGKKRLVCLHIHDNDGKHDLHMMPYTYVCPNHKQVTEWDGMVEGLRDIGYDGTLSLEAGAVWWAFPEPLRPTMMKLLSETCRYWISRIERPAGTP